MLAYAVTIFLSAFLLFQVQPLMGKYILPWFGGAPGVWTACLLFFQVLLLGGYAYAHLLSRWLRPRRQALIHGALLLVAVLLLPITPSDAWKPRGDAEPVSQILTLLAACLGLPYFVLSATGPLLQKWFTRTNPGVSPYRLYALSNVGSLLALMTYPFLVETNLTRAGQSKFWGWGFAGFVACCGFCALRLWRANPLPAELGASPPPAGRKTPFATNASVVDRALWLLLPACASVLLLATTNKLCQDIAVIPFLWVLPLAIYLVSFIISFDSPRWYVRGGFALALVAASGGVCRALFLETDLSLGWQVFIYLGALFVGCMICHGELYRLRPPPEKLTAFYLMIAAGGALGGVFVAVLAPLIFSSYYEMHWGLLLNGLLLLGICLRAKDDPAGRAWRGLAVAFTVLACAGVDVLLVWLNRRYPDVVAGRLIPMRLAWWGALVVVAGLWIARKQHQTFRHWRYVVCFWLALGWLGLATALWFQVWDFGERIVSQSRNFYGTLRVCEYRKDEPDSHYFLLEHGRITHGLQFVDPQFARLPTTYYGGSNGVARSVAALPEGPRRIGLVGLGVGTTAAYLRPGDSLRVYEINSEVVRLAGTRFRYLSNCPAKLDIVLGDARLSLEHEPPQNFDLLTLDAFSSDAIPVHLLTQEAFEVYARHLKPEGIIAVHVSNRYLSLEPVVANAARRFGFQAATIDYEKDEDEDDEGEWWVYESTWVLLCRDPGVLNRPEIRAATSEVKTNGPGIPLWTDDFASIFQIMK